MMQGGDRFQDPRPAPPAAMTNHVADPRSAAPVIAYIGLGSNQGDRAAALRRAIGALAALPGVSVDAVSSFYETDPWGNTNQPRFYNAVARISTTLGPRQLLVALKWIERRQGRKPGVRWGQRVIDLDLLLYGDQHVSRTGLEIPHRHMHERAFVLVPLREVFPEYRPPDGRSLSALLDDLDAARVVWPVLDPGEAVR